MISATSPTNATSHPNWISPRVAFLNDSVATTNALLMPTGVEFGRAINGVSFQADILITFNGYQYTAWYDNVGTAQTVWLARRSVNGTTAGAWQPISTGSLFVNGKAKWDAHNVISLGVSPMDGTLHMSWDHHSNKLRYRRSVRGLCTTNTAAWGAGMMNAEQNWLVASGQAVASVTYPCFYNSPAGDLIFEYRVGSSASGDTWMHYYNPTTGVWNARWQFVTRSGTFTGLSNGGTNVSSTTRNAYDNGFDFGPDGTLHYTWTFREKGTFNHDIHYAYSTNGGATWLNNPGAVVADKSSAQNISVNSPGIILKVIDGTQEMINQQAQCVDRDGRVHVLMSHRRVEPGFEWQAGDSAFGGPDTAYYHYFRDPASGVWSQRRLSVSPYRVGSRPKIGFDQQGNVYAVFTYGGKLVVDSASKASSYSDWANVATLNGAFNGEPLIDQNRLTADGILSVFLQKDGPSSTTPIGTALQVMDFVANVPMPNPVSVMFLKPGIVVTIASQAGYSYQLQTRPNLEAGDWTDVGPALSGTGELLALSHPTGANDPCRFYRVVRTP
jgi:hypothetical protein